MEHVIQCVVDKVQPWLPNLPEGAGFCEGRGWIGHDSVKRVRCSVCGGTGWPLARTSTNEDVIS
jgi:hypothetical protein